MFKKNIVKHKKYEGKQHTCAICGNRNLKNIKALQLHLVKKHKMNKVALKKYYDSNLKCEGEGICSVTGKETEYKNMTSGYETVCFEVRKSARIPTQYMYWVVKHGFTEEEAKIKVSVLQGERGKNTPKGDDARKNSPRCIEYWINKFNMNVDAATLMVSQQQSDVVSKKTLAQHKLSALTLENQIRLYGVEEGTKRWESYKEKKRAAKPTSSNISKIEQTFCHMIELLGFRGKWGEKQLILTEEKVDERCYWRYDFSYRNKIIELNGDYYHGLLTEKTKGNKSSDEIIEKDRRKKEYATSCGYEVLIVLESEFRKDPISVLNKCKIFLQKENNYVDKI